MLKYIAITIIFLSFFYVGYSVKKSYKNKLQFLTDFNNLLLLILNEISNNKTSLVDIYNNYISSNNNDLSVFLLKYLDNYNDNFNDLFKKSLLLTNNEKKSLINMLNVGMYDYDSAITQVKNNLTKINLLITNSKDDLVKKGDLYFKLSIMLGLAISLIAI